MKQREDDSARRTECAGRTGKRPVALVKTGSRIRARFTLADVKVRPSGWIQIANDVTIEIEGSAKPALTARWLTLAFVPPEKAG